MKLDTKAAETRTIRFEDLQTGDIVHTGDIITISSSKMENGGNKLSLACNKPNGGELCYNLGHKENTDGAEMSVEVGSVTHEGRTYTAFKLHHKVDDTHFALFDFIVENETETGTETEKQNSIQSHACSYQWITTIDPTTGADGLEEYKCVLWSRTGIPSDSCKCGSSQRLLWKSQGCAGKWNGHL